MLQSTSKLLKLLEVTDRVSSISAINDALIDLRKYSIVLDTLEDEKTYLEPFINFTDKTPTNMYTQYMYVSMLLDKINAG